MNPQYCRTTQQRKAARANYLNNLVLKNSVNQQNLNANTIFQQTGVPPVPPADTRSTTEKMADVAKIRVALRQYLQQITDAENANDIVNSLDDENILWLMNRIEEVVKILKDKWKLGIPAPAFLEWWRRYLENVAATGDAGLGLQQNVGENMAADLDAVVQLMVQMRNALDDLADAVMGTGGGGGGSSSSSSSGGYGPSRSNTSSSNNDSLTSSLTSGNYLAYPSSSSSAGSSAVDLTLASGVPSSVASSLGSTVASALTSDHATRRPHFSGAKSRNTSSLVSIINHASSQLPQPSQLQAIAHMSDPTEREAALQNLSQLSASMDPDDLHSIAASIRSSRSLGANESVNALIHQAAAILQQIVDSEQAFSGAQSSLAQSQQSPEEDGSVSTGSYGLPMPPTPDQYVGIMEGGASGFHDARFSPPQVRVYTPGSVIDMHNLHADLSRENEQAAQYEGPRPSPSTSSVASVSSSISPEDMLRQKVQGRLKPRRHTEFTPLSVEQPDEVTRLLQGLSDVPGATPSREQFAEIERNALKNKQAVEHHISRLKHQGLAQFQERGAAHSHQFEQSRLGRTHYDERGERNAIRALKANVLHRQTSRLIHASQEKRRHDNEELRQLQEISDALDVRKHQRQLEAQFQEEVEKQQKTQKQKEARKSEKKAKQAHDEAELHRAIVEGQQRAHSSPDLSAEEAETRAAYEDMLRRAHADKQAKMIAKHGVAQFVPPRASPVAVTEPQTAGGKPQGKKSGNRKFPDVYPAEVSSLFTSIRSPYGDANMAGRLQSLYANKTRQMDELNMASAVQDLDKLPHDLALRWIGLAVPRNMPTDRAQWREAALKSALAQRGKSFQTVGRGLKIGRGLARSRQSTKENIDYDDGLEQTPNYVPFGKHFIHRHKLIDDNILQIRREKGSVIKNCQRKPSPSHWPRC